MINNTNNEKALEIANKSNLNIDKYASILTNYSIISVTGIDSKKFLQGQISVNMEKLLPLHWQLGVACDHKGRMYATFKLIADKDRYLLILPSSLIENTLSTLKKYTPFFKVSLEQQDCCSIGFLGNNIENEIKQTFNISILPQDDQVHSENNLLIFSASTTSQSFQCILPQNDLASYEDKLIQYFKIDTGNKWYLNNIRNVIAELHSEIAYKYIPQNLNQPSIGAVSFRKGCFTGQEIITRTQNLGNVKLRVYHLTVAENNKLKLGDDLFDTNGKTIGNIIQLQLDTETNTNEILAVLKYDATSEEKLFIDNQTKVEVSINKTPYSINTKLELQQ